LVVGGSAEGALVFRTVDGGDSWTSVRARLPERARKRQLRAVWFMSGRRAVAVGERGLLLVTPDGGNSWKVIRTGTNAWLRSIHFPTPETGYIAGTHGVVLETDDGGEHWRPTPTALRGRLNAVRFVNRLEGYVVTMEGKLFGTRDGGKTWTLVATARGALTSIHLPPSGPQVVVGDDGTILRRSGPRFPGDNPRTDNETLGAASSAR